MKLKKIAVFFLSLLLIISLASCSKVENITNYPATINGVTIDAEPTAVVSLSPSITSAINELNLADKLVGVSNFCPTITGKEDLPKLGTAQNPDIENIVKLKPEVVLTSSAMSKKNITELSDNGIKTIVIPSVSTLDDLSGFYDNIAACLIGNSSGKAKSENTYKNLMDRIDFLKNKIGSVDGKTYLFVETLSGNVATGDTFENSILNTISLKNVAESATSWVMDAQAITNSNPDYVFYSSSITPDQLKASSLFGNLAAVKEGRAVQISTQPFEYQSTSMFDSLYAIAKAVYPDCFDSSSASSQTESTPSSASSSAQ